MCSLEHAWCACLLLFLSCIFILLIYFFSPHFVSRLHWFCNPMVIDQNCSRSLSTEHLQRGQNSSPPPNPPAPAHLPPRTLTHPPEHRLSLVAQTKGFKLLESGQVSHAEPPPPTGGLLTNPAHLCRTGPKQGSMSRPQLRPHFSGGRSPWIG